MLRVLGDAVSSGRPVLGPRHLRRPSASSRREPVRLRPSSQAGDGLRGVLGGRLEGKGRQARSGVVVQEVSVVEQVVPEVPVTGALGV